MTPEELREAVARTLCDEADFDPDTDWNLPSFLRKADAVIATVRGALRVPSEGMLHQGGASSDHPSVFMGGPSYGGKTKAERIWRAMFAASPLGGPKHD
jgi:hypothetical protein